MGETRSMRTRENTYIILQHSHRLSTSLTLYLTLANYTYLWIYPLAVLLKACLLQFGWNKLYIIQSPRLSREYSGIGYLCVLSFYKTLFLQTFWNSNFLQTNDIFVICEIQRDLDIHIQCHLIICEDCLFRRDCSSHVLGFRGAKRDHFLALRCPWYRAIR